MKIVIAATAEQKACFDLKDGKDADLVWLNKSEDLWSHTGADGYVDLQFNIEHLPQLKSLLPKTVIINSVEHTLDETDAGFVRINGWPGFMKGGAIEAAGYEGRRPSADAVMRRMGKELSWLPDVTGFVAPRVLSMIINEAFFALDEGVSTKAEIDKAMKLGTAYPLGPFEWAEKIGLQNVIALLKKLATSEKRYAPASLLLKAPVN